MRLAVKIREDRDVDAEPAEHLKPARLHIQRSGVGELLVEVHMKMAHQHLVAGHLLVAVVMSECHDGLLRVAAILRAEVEIHGHALPRSRWRVVERKIVDVVPGFVRSAVPHFVRNTVGTIRLFAVRLAHTDGERGFAVLAIVDIAEIRFNFAREEELVRRRQKGQRAARCFHDRQPVSSLHCDKFAVDAAPKSVLLPFAGHIAPDNASVSADRQALEARDIFISDRGLVGLRDGFLPQQIGSFVNGVAQEAIAKAVELDFQPGAVRFYNTAGRVIARRRPADLLGFARKIHVVVGSAGNHKGRVPEGVPFLAVDDFRRELHAEFT